MNTSFSPATLATLLAAKRRSANATLVTSGPQVYTSESSGYRFVPSTFPAGNEETESVSTDTNDEVDLPEMDCDVVTGAYGDPWTSWTLADLGIDDTPHLRRFDSIDPLDPTEALDTNETFVGMRVFTP